MSPAHTQPFTLLTRCLRSEIPESEDTDATPSIPPTLLPPLSLLSANLNFLARSLPPQVVTSLYRRIATAIAQHITQRVIFHRARGRFTEQTGRLFVEEAKLWIQTSGMALGGSVRRPELPWASLVDAAAIVAIAGNEFQPIVRAAFEGDDQAFDKIKEDMGIRTLDRSEMQAALRARAECWR